MYAAGRTERSQLEAEFLSLIEVQEHMPNPYAWGRLELATHAQGWFLLTHFVDFREGQLPNPFDTVVCVAKKTALGATFYWNSVRASLG